MESSSSNSLRAIRRFARARSKDVLIRTGVGRKLLLHKYRYMYSPEQLWALCQAAEEVSSLGGVYAEIGVYDGATTTFIQRHLLEQGLEPKAYYCIDTFGGFTAEDMEAERARGKAEDFTEDLKDLFFDVSKECFERTMHHNDIDNVVVIKADATTFDYSSLPPLAFALVDVDLLRPVRAALAGCWARLLPGGIMVVDDCDSSVSVFDGALEAFREFCQKEGLPVDLRHRKLGFVRKPAQERTSR